MIFGLDYVKIGVVVLLLCGIFFAGWHIRDMDFTAYKMEQQEIVIQQESKVESIQKQHELVTKGIQDEYDAKLALIRNYYANGVQHPNGSRPVSSISSTTAISDAISAYNQLAGNCAQTTLQLVELQKWINEQIGIK